MKNCNQAKILCAFVFLQIDQNSTRAVCTVRNCEAIMQNDIELYKSDNGPFLGVVAKHSFPISLSIKKISKVYCKSCKGLNKKV